MNADTATRPHYVYWCYNDAATDPDERLVYVGCTVDLERRLGQHKTEAPWFKSITRVQSSKYPDRKAGLRAEAAIIRRNRPLYNMQSNRLRTFEPPANAIERLTLKEVAGLTGLHIRSVATGIRLGDLKSTDGATVTREDVQAWVDSWPYADDV